MTAIRYNVCHQVLKGRYSVLFSTTGLVKDRFYISGSATYPVHLLDSLRPVLFEAGTTSVGKIYVDAIRSILGKRQPAILFLTHVHWDHCGAASYLKDAFPSLKIAASHEASEILKRQSAIELIAKLNRSATAIVASLPGVDPSMLTDEAFRPFNVDMELKDGQIIELEEGMTVEILATPGHTRDLLSFYLPQAKILIASEASGCLDSAGNIMTEFLSDYDAYLNSLQRLADLPAEVLCQGHRIVFVGREEVKAFFTRSVSEAIRFKERIYELLGEEGGSMDRVVGRIKAERYDIIKGIKQPEVPYLINLRAQVTHLAGKKISA